MLKKILAIGALAIAFPAQAAVTINYVGGANAMPPGLTTIENFEGFAPLSSIGTNANVYTASVPSVAAQPAFNSTGKFAAILNGGSYTKTFAPTSIFSFVIGSLDAYNKITLTFASGGPLVLTGAQIALGATANGNQTLTSSNGRVIYTVNGGDPLITGITFESSGNSMEIDDLAVAAVPEPTTWLMMLMGFAAVGFSMRRKQNLRPSFA